MTMKTFTCIWIASLLALLSNGVQAQGTKDDKRGFDHHHQALTAILKKHVKNGRVDYRDLKKNAAPLMGYLNRLAAVREPEFRTWNKDLQMAFLINLYNAATLKLIIDHYPVDSIKDIGGWFSGPWDKKVVRLFGDKVTLDHLEHDILRPKYKDPRIHFAVNCASIGCPVLRPEAFQASKLDQQLDEQGRIFLNNDAKNRLDAADDTLHLSPIFDWFEEDFTDKAGTVQKYVARYFPEKERDIILKRDLDIEHTDYDWSLNEH